MPHRCPWVTMAAKPYHQHIGHDVPVRCAPGQGTIAHAECNQESEPGTRPCRPHGWATQEMRSRQVPRVEKRAGESTWTAEQGHSPSTVPSRLTMAADGGTHVLTSAWRSPYTEKQGSTSPSSTTTPRSTDVRLQADLQGYSGFPPASSDGPQPGSAFVEYAGQDARLLRLSREQAGPVVKDETFSSITGMTTGFPPLPHPDCIGWHRHADPGVGRAGRPALLPGSPRNP
jgi:hypothetical protein